MKFIALLRGINVAGQKKIKMEDLRNQLEKLDYTNIKTYIQSGNIVFDCKNMDTKTIETQIKTLIKEHFGYDVPTLVRLGTEINDIISNNPYQDVNHKSLYVTLLDSIPFKENIDLLESYNYDGEEYKILGKNIYFYVPKGYGKAKMDNNFFEKKLKTSATTRNWNTINKLAEMAKN